MVSCGAFKALAVALAITLVAAWDESTHEMLDDALFADLVAQDSGFSGEDNALSLMQATARLHQRGTGDAPSLAALAAADDASDEVGDVSATSLLQTFAEHRLQGESERQPRTAPGRLARKVKPSKKIEL
ncbi:unnamed protein product [Polarella glacialis]|uniref:Uncharacterized protein n=1 Tax=Polarella glacialis TaxID=89957 RepID=A0A813HA30_POLGL|nr:unnamed protein product [Polarella glacialis]CAE8651064.1 unnamed protein product [Polarella glacialis]|mmetsp:Transcript_52683/g.85407  ORF Transcript_52683/g.85407 Transcript_52683/m.85407 type:complete len:130 (-) Transcript_52683:127-516(-)